MDIATDLDFIVGAVGRISRPAFVAANGGSLNSLADFCILSWFDHLT